MRTPAAVLEAARGKTEFLAIGRPSALKIKGVGQGPRGDLAIEPAGDKLKLKGEVAVDLTSFDTGISMRDRHMKDKYLEVGKYHDAKLIFTDAEVPAGKVKGGGEAEVQAVLDLHGEQKSVPVAMVFENKGGVVKTVAKFKIKLSEYKIEIPSFSGITVADEVNVTTETEVKL